MGFRYIGSKARIAKAILDHIVEQSMEEWRPSTILNLQAITFATNLTRRYPSERLTSPVCRPIGGRTNPEGKTARLCSRKARNSAQTSTNRPLCEEKISDG